MLSNTLTMKWLPIMSLLFCGVATCKEPVQLPSSCHNLAPEMAQFAQQLTPENQALFCKSFTEEMRKEAMKRGRMMCNEMVMQMHKEKEMSMPMSSSQQGDPKAMTPKTPPCNGMSNEASSFAVRLTPDNQKLFCTEFTEAMRKEAMERSEGMGMYATPMNPNEAVLMVAKKGKRKCKTCESP